MWVGPITAKELNATGMGFAIALNVFTKEVGCMPMTYNEVLEISNMHIEDLEWNASNMSRFEELLLSFGGRYRFAFSELKESEYEIFLNSMAEFNGIMVCVLENKTKICAILNGERLYEVKFRKWRSGNTKTKYYIFDFIDCNKIIK